MWESRKIFEKAKEKKIVRRKAQAILNRVLEINPTSQRKSFLFLRFKKKALSK